MGAAEEIYSFEDEPLIDERKIKSIKALGDGDDGFFHELTDLFFERVPVLLAEIKSSLAEKDAYKLERSSHALKGTSGNLGVIRMMKICEYLEGQGRDKALDGLEYLVEDLHRIYPDIEAAVKEYI